MAKKDKEEKKADDKVDKVVKDSSDPSVPGDAADTGDAADAGDSGDAGDAKDLKPEAEPEKPAEPDWKALYAITLADFDNYKKRAARDREDVYRYAESDILKDILPVVDNLALALESAKAEGGKSDSSGEGAPRIAPASQLASLGGYASPLVKGVQMVYDGLLKALADHGAKPMEDLVGKELDPNFHEAIATLPDEKIEEGKISNVAKVGWLLNEKLLRAAQVVVSAGKANG